MANFKPEQTLEEMLETMNKSDGNTETIHAGASFIQYKLQEKLLEKQDERQKELLNSQNNYNSKQLFWSKVLALSTIALVVANLLLIKFG